ncbi:MAG: hypothetical protein JXQ29_06475 [Planctomycetes bacterium]|nr:hypothetical protein [Planctomycetota bacterium]
MFTSTSLETLELWAIFGVWLVPGLLAAVLWRRSRPGSRAAWLLVAAGCLVFSADKLLDLQVQFYRVAHRLLRTAVECGLGDGARLPLRIVVLGSGLAVVLVVFRVFVRQDRQIDWPKGLAVGGVVWIVVYVGARLVPAVANLITPEAHRIAEGTGLLLAWSGTVIGWLRGKRLR